jgi:Rha family phage regulatory protein
VICLPSRRQITKSINALSILTQLKEDFMQKNIKKTTKQDVQNSPIVQANYNVLGIEFVSKDDQPMVSSVQVAENFGKQHKDVLRAIKNLDVPEDFNRRNFAPVEYEDKKGEKRPAYLMTRDGFTLLVMGVTGPKAME